MPPAATAAARRSTHANGRRAAAPPPRRVSGPTRPSTASHTRSAPRGARSGGLAAPRPLGFRLAELVHGLAQHRMLDRLMRGRLWIAILGTGLIGIVFMQVAMLRMNTGIGHAVERASTLERQNSALQSSISELSSSDRIAAAAAAAGMIRDTGATDHFLSAANVNIGKAVDGISPPSTTPPQAAVSTGSSVAAAAAAAGATADPAPTATDTTTTAMTSTQTTGTTTATTTAAATQTPAASQTAGAAQAQTQSQSTTQTPTPQPNPGTNIGGGAAATGP